MAQIHTTKVKSNRLIYFNILNAAGVFRDIVVQEDEMSPTALLHNLTSYSSTKYQVRPGLIASKGVLSPTILVENITDPLLNFGADLAICYVAC